MNTLAFRLRAVAIIGHGPIILFALASRIAFFQVGSGTGSTSTIVVNAAVLGVLILARLFWLGRVWRGQSWARRHFFDALDLALACALVWQNGFDGYERIWGILAIPQMLAAAGSTIYVHRVLRKFAHQPP